MKRVAEKGSQKKLFWRREVSQGEQAFIAVSEKVKSFQLKFYTFYYPSSAFCSLLGDIGARNFLQHANERFALGHECLGVV